jgi:hypothetical protein
MQRQHRETAQAFADQPAHVVQTAQERAHDLAPYVTRITARAAVTFAKDRNLERTAVVDERVILRDALTLGMGALPFAASSTVWQPASSSKSINGPGRQAGPSPRAR